MKKNTNLRSQLFKHLDGLVTAPIAYSLKKSGVLDFILKKQKVSLAQIDAEFKVNIGYINVALRVLASQDFIQYQSGKELENISIEILPWSSTAFELFDLYEDVVLLSQFSARFPMRTFHEEPFLKQKLIFEKFKQNYGLTQSDDPKTQSIQERILDHIEGNLVAPTLVRLSMNGMFHKYFMETRFRPEEFHKYPEHFAEILNFFVHLGWFKEYKGFYEFTEDGLFFAKKASSYGVTVSYLPLFREMDALLFGNPHVLRNIPEGADEQHVDRTMNVWGSGGAHSTYFKVIDSIIIELFNRPIEEQPKGILDMGCGNGAFLQHLFEVIDRQTTRGKMLDEYPLFLVGADYNEAALKVTRANLINADIWAKVIWGDISRPDLLAADLAENYQISLSDLLNVRTFLDHNRIWETPNMENSLKLPESTGAFAHRGQWLSNDLVALNLFEHFQKWTPFVSKFGLLVIELHTIAPEITAQNLGKTAATAYDATHGFSDQFILEETAFRATAELAGLFSEEKIRKSYPNEMMPTVSIHLLKGKNTI